MNLFENFFLSLSYDLRPTNFLRKKTFVNLLSTIVSPVYSLFNLTIGEYNMKKEKKNNFHVINLAATVAAGVTQNVVNLR